MRFLRFILKLTVLLAAYLAALVAYSVPYGWTGAAVLLIGVACKKGYRFSAYGTARWASHADLRRWHMLEGSGVIIGTIPGRPSRMEGLRALFSRRLPASDAVTAFLQTCQRSGHQPQNLVTLTHSVHTAVFAPSGAGKNVSCVYPLLLTCPEPCIVLDFKGENARITGPHRAKAFGLNSVLIDPFKVVTQTPASFNLLASIDPNDPESFEQVRAMAEAGIQKEPNARDPHWAQKAEIFLTGVILAVVHFYPPEHRNLQVVASIMADKKLLSAAIQKLQQSQVHNGLLARIGTAMSIPSGTELDGILSTIDRSLNFLSTPAVVESTTGSTGGFDPAELAHSTVYLILPMQYMRSHACLLRLWVTALTRSVVSRGVENPTPVNVILDEAAALGHFEAIDDMLNIGRGFGLKLILIYQSMGQLMQCWPNGQHQTLLSNTTQVFFGVNDQQTAEYVSNRLGESTIVIEEDSDSTSTTTQSKPQGGDGGSYTTGRSRSRKQLGRKLLKPEEVAALNPRTAITFTQGFPPIASTLVRYYDKSFRMPRRMGLLKAAVDTACLFLTVATLAVAFTAALYYHHPR